MSYGLDVNGYDNTPEWGTCKAPGCKEPAYPIWYSGGEPDEPDLLLCEAHIGARILELEKERSARDTVIRDSISDILGRALAGYTDDYKLIEHDGGKYIRWGQVQDDIRALFDKEHPVADVMNDNRDMLHQLTTIRAKLERAETARKAAIARGAALRAVAEAARALAAGPDSTAWERLYAALAVAEKVSTHGL